MHKITTVDSNTGSASHADKNPLHAATIRTLRANPYQLLLRDESGNSLAHHAVINDNQAQLEACLNMAPSLAFFRNHLGQSPIMLSVVLNKTDLFSHLLEKYPHTLYQRDKYGHTALGFAIEQDKPDVLEIVRYKAPEHLKKRDAADGLSPIFKCIRDGALQCLNYLIEEFPDMLTETNAAGQTPIEYAAQFSYLPSIQLLLSCPQSNHQLVELMNVAAQHRQLFVLRALIDAVPGILAMKNSNNQSPVTLAILNGDTAALSYYFDRQPGLLFAKVSADDTPGLFAARHDRSDSLAFIKSRHPNLLNEHNSQGQNIINVASVNESVSCTRFMMGAAPNLFRKRPLLLMDWHTDWLSDATSLSEEYVIQTQAKQCLRQIIQQTYPDAEPNEARLKVLVDSLLIYPFKKFTLNYVSVSTRLSELMAFIHDPSNDANQRKLNDMTYSSPLLFSGSLTLLSGLLCILCLIDMADSLLNRNYGRFLFSAGIFIAFMSKPKELTQLTRYKINANNAISTFKADVAKWATPTVQAKSEDAQSTLGTDNDSIGKDECKQTKAHSTQP